MSKWLYQGPQISYWVPSFFFPQGFMTATLQTYARSEKKPIDTLKFKTTILTQFKEKITKLPDIGVNIYGLYLQGANWNGKEHILDESIKRILFV